MFDNNQIDKLAHATVFDNTGDKVGKVGQIYADNETGQPTFATVKTGLFGNSETFVPLQEARFEGDDLHVGYTKDQIKDAPRIDEDGELSPQEEDRLYQHYSLAGADHDRDRHHDADAAGVAGGVDRDRHHDRDVDVDRDREHGDLRDGQTVSASEERLRVGTESRERGRARIRKYTTSETQSVEVPVKKEKLVVEHEETGGRVRPGGLDENGGRTGDIDEEITLREERAVVGKETFEHDRVRIGTETVEGTETVSGEVRKEHIDVDAEHTDGRNRRDDVDGTRR